MNELMPRDVPYATGSMENAKMVRQATIRERLDMAVKQADERLKNVQRAKELFEKNPDLEELLNIMQNAHF